MAKHPPGLVVPYWHASEYPTVEGLRCVPVLVPDDDKYVAALAGLYALMTNYYAWEGTYEERGIKRDLLLEAYAATEWENCMDCDDVQECIETHEGTQEAIREIVERNTQFPANFPYGEKLPLSRQTQDLSTASNPTCNLSILFGQCYGVVDLINDSIVDVLEKIEVTTNVVELAKEALGTIPVVAGAEKAIGIDGAIGMINYFQETVLEGYAAQYTVTPGGTRDEIACAIFCECREDCTITIERLRAVMDERLSVYISPPSLAGFVDLVETLAGINVDTTFVVDLAFYATIGLLVTGNYLFGGAAGNVLDLVIKLKADEPNNDWEILCPCSPVCRSEWNYDDPLPDTSVVVGTLDPSGYVASGLLDAGGGDTAWIIFDYELPVLDLVQWRWIVDAPGTYAYQCYGDTFFEDGESEAVSRDDGLFEVSVVFDPPVSGDAVTTNMRRVPIGNTDVFNLVRIEVVYEC